MSLKLLLSNVYLSVTVHHMYLKRQRAMQKLIIMVNLLKLARSEHGTRVAEQSRVCGRKSRGPV